jgi:hypothetical protein
MYRPISDFPMVNRTAVTTAPTTTSPHSRCRSGRPYRWPRREWRRNPSAATNPTLVARARMSRDRVVPFGLAFHMAFSADCISPNTPDAVAINVTMPTIVATMPDDLPAALATALCNTSAVCGPMRALNCAMIAFWAASRPKASPAMAMAISRTGAIEVTA